MKKVYICHPISTTGEFNDSIRVAERIKNIYQTKEVTTEENDVMGTVNEPKYDVYAPALNKAINDKSNNPTPQMIYEQDVDNLLSADVVIINYTGGDSDGTVLEMGLLGGLTEGIGILSEIKNDFKDNKNEVLDYITTIKYMTGKSFEEREVIDIHHFLISKVIAEYFRRLPKIYAYSSNQRALKPQLYNLVINKLYEAGIDKALEGYIPSGKLNAMVLGLVEKHFNWCESEDAVIRALEVL